MTLRAFKKSCILVNFKNLGELWTTIKIREKILFAVELTQSWQICAEYLANVGL